MRLTKAETIMFTGNMWGGKTYALHHRLKTDAFRGMKVLCLENPYNTRGSERDIENLENKNYTFRLINPAMREEILEDIRDYDIVAFDEVHLYFLDKKIYNDGAEALFKECFKVARSTAKRVYISSLLLDSDSDNELFPIMKDIVLQCDTIKVFPSSKECSVCGSHSDVIFCDRQIGHDSNIGDHYDVVCYDCYNKKKES